jgi:spermidine synthase
VLENLQWNATPNVERFAGVIENRSGIITVTAQGVVYGHGMYDGRFNTDLKHDNNGIVRPYALSLFHPAPRDVLMVGRRRVLGHRSLPITRTLPRSRLSRSTPATLR